MFDKFILSLKKISAEHDHYIEHVAVRETAPDFMIHVASSWLGRRGTEHVQTGALSVSDGAVRGTAGAHVQKEPTRSEGLSEEVET